TTTLDCVLAGRKTSNDRALERLNRVHSNLWVLLFEKLADSCHCTGRSHAEADHIDLNVTLPPNLGSGSAIMRANVPDCRTTNNCFLHKNNQFLIVKLWFIFLLSRMSTRVRN
ncbi:hypothetical protein PMAYCL1PPCAC_21354, partial [Pristionchus mayeri]